MRPARPLVSPTGFDRLLAPLHRWIWRDAERRVHKLIRFGETETDGGRDILRAAEVTSDPLLRRLYLVHALDEQRHGVLFRQPRPHSFPRCRRHRGRRSGPIGSHQASVGSTISHVDDESDESLLAFLHLSEKAAAGRFALYREVLTDDPPTRAVFEEILHDEMFHMNYTLAQLARVAPHQQGRRLWRARARPALEGLSAPGDARSPA